MFLYLVETVVLRDPRILNSVFRARVSVYDVYNLLQLY